MNTQIVYTDTDTDINININEDKDKLFKVITFTFNNLLIRNRIYQYVKDIHNHLEQTFHLIVEEKGTFRGPKLNIKKPLVKSIKWSWKELMDDPIALITFDYFEPFKTSLTLLEQKYSKFKWNDSIDGDDGTSHKIVPNICKMIETATKLNNRFEYLKEIYNRYRHLNETIYFLEKYTVKNCQYQSFLYFYQESFSKTSLHRGFTSYLDLANLCNNQELLYHCIWSDFNNKNKIPYFTDEELESYLYHRYCGYKVIKYVAESGTKLGSKLNVHYPKLLRLAVSKRDLEGVKYLCSFNLDNQEVLKEAMFLSIETNTSLEIFKYFAEEVLNDYREKFLNSLFQHVVAWGSLQIYHYLIQENPKFYITNIFGVGFHGKKRYNSLIIIDHLHHHQQPSFLKAHKFSREEIYILVSIMEIMMKSGDSRYLDFLQTCRIYYNAEFKFCVDNQLANTIGTISQDNSLFYQLVHYKTTPFDECLKNAIYKENIEIVKWIIDQRKHIENRFSLRSYIIHQSNIDIFKYLFQSEYIDQMDACYQNAMVRAFEQKSLPLVQYLLESPSLLQYFDMDLTKYFMSNAIQYGSTQQLKYLLNKWNITQLELYLVTPIWYTLSLCNDSGVGDRYNNVKLMLDLLKDDSVSYGFAYGLTSKLNQENKFWISYDMVEYLISKKIHPYQTITGIRDWNQTPNTKRLEFMIQLYVNGHHSKEFWDHQLEEIELIRFLHFNVSKRDGVRILINHTPKRLYNQPFSEIIKTKTTNTTMDIIADYFNQFKSLFFGQPNNTNNNE